MGILNKLALSQQESYFESLIIHIIKLIVTYFIILFYYFIITNYGVKIMNLNRKWKEHT